MKEQEIKPKPVRVLHVLGTTNLGGAESRIMELYRCIDRSQVQFDFLIHTKEDGHYSEEIRSLGGHIYSLPRFKFFNIAEYRKAIHTFFKEHTEFSVVQGHMTSTAAIYLPIAKQEYGRRSMPLITAAHARSAGVDKGLKGLATRILRLPLKNRADYLFTCSKEAGIAVYGARAVREGRVWTIPNAIDAQRFSFQQKVRDEIRSELGIQDKFVIGHVGRFGFMKNHTYLVDVFAKICETRKDAVLVMIGQGELEETIREKVKSLGLEDRAYFLGNRYDVEKYYQAFDYFVFPSTFEGLPGSVAEAQAAGLHCLVSDKVTREVALTDLVAYRSIEEDSGLWAEEILGNAQAALVREDMREAIAQKGFDVRRQAVQMAEFYRTGQNPPGHTTE
mgnify:FL=1